MDAVKESDVTTNEHAWKRFCNPLPGESYEDCQERLIKANAPENKFPTEAQRVEMASRKAEWH